MAAECLHVPEATKVVNDCVAISEHMPENKELVESDIEDIIGKDND